MTIERKLKQLSPVSPNNVLKVSLGSIGPERQFWARKIIAWISCSFRPLTVQELEAALVLDKDPERTKLDDLVFQDILAELRECFGSIFIVEHNEIHFGHPFARDFFIAADAS
jgi:hypothetical protein